MEHSISFMIGYVMIIVMVLGGVWWQLNNLNEGESGATLFVIVWYAVAMTLLLN